MSALTLNDARRHLNITSTTSDGELQSMIDAAEAAIAKRVGPLSSTTVTARVSGARSLLLPVLPVLSLTSLTAVGGAALTVGALNLDVAAGVVTLPSGAFSAVGYDVVYQAGRVTVPEDLLMAVKELVRHFWMTQRGPTQRPGSGASDAASNTVPGAAHLFPFRVESMIAPYEMLAGFA